MKSKLIYVVGRYVLIQCTFYLECSKYFFIFMMLCSHLDDNICKFVVVFQEVFHGMIFVPACSHNHCTTDHGEYRPVHTGISTVLLLSSRYNLKQLMRFHHKGSV